jgi:hypothetical protein
MRISVCVLGQRARGNTAFDVDGLKNYAFAPPPYLKLIGFEVPREFLEQTFLEVYGFDVHEVLSLRRTI